MIEFVPDGGFDDVGGFVEVEVYFEVFGDEGFEIVDGEGFFVFDDEGEAGLFGGSDGDAGKPEDLFVYAGVFGFEVCG